MRMIVQEEGVNNLRTSAVRKTVIAAAVLVLSSLYAWAQEPSTVAAAPPNNETTLLAVRDLQQELRQLRALVDDMRAENAQSRAEMLQLRQELQSTRNLLEHTIQPSSDGAVASSPLGSPVASVPITIQTSQQDEAVSKPVSGLEDRVQKLEETTSLLGSKVDEQFQTKVETASKYRVRLSGIVLMNAFRNVGTSDNMDFPNYAQPPLVGTSQTNAGATLRQSQVGLEIFGPTVAGAKTSADIRFDFAGGFPATGNGVNFGIVRLQTGSLRFEWEHTSVIAGQDSLFLSPLSPTSFASLAIPTFADAGNLWGWIPQLRVEHRFDLSDRQTLTVQAGILDNLSWEPPFNSYFRYPQSGEQSGQPAYGVRTAWSQVVFDHPLSFGVGGYYSRQDWSWNRYVDGWAGMLDWNVPLIPRLILSGEFYRGRGAGALGAGISRPVIFGGAPFDPATPIRGLDSAGGWSQLKFQLTSKLELNGVFAEDNAFARDIRGFATDQNNFDTILGRNHGLLGNIVYRPRSDLLFAAEFRRLHSFPVYSDSRVTNQVNLAMGILF
jgi:hypothetical protein